MTQILNRNLYLKFYSPIVLVSTMHTKWLWMTSHYQFIGLKNSIAPLFRIRNTEIVFMSHERKFLAQRTCCSHLLVGNPPTTLNLVVELHKRDFRLIWDSKTTDKIDTLYLFSQFDSSHSSVSPSKSTHGYSY